MPSAEEAALKASRQKERREVADHPLLFMGRRPEHKDLIDMTAMVDIVFFLLIFFLVTSMQSIEADYGSLAGTLPKSEFTELDNDVLGNLLRVFNDPARGEGSRR